jgi:hypothetical protein
LALLMLIAILGSLILLGFRLIGGLAVTLVLVILVVVIAYMVFAKASVWLPLFPSTGS